MRKQHVITLTPAQRDALRHLVRRDATTALEQRRARILLASDAGAGLAPPTDLAVATAVGVDPRTVARVRATFTRDGFTIAVHGRPRRFPPRSKLSSAQEARVAALASSTPPPGHARWSLRLLAARVVELEIVPGICAETVRTTLKKSGCSLGARSAG
jgi:homeodomain-containing protein